MPVTELRVIDSPCEYSFANNSIEARKTLLVLLV